MTKAYRRVKTIYTEAVLVDTEDNTRLAVTNEKKTTNVSFGIIILDIGEILRGLNKSSNRLL